MPVDAFAPHSSSRTLDKFAADLGGKKPTRRSTEAMFSKESACEPAEGLCKLRGPQSPYLPCALNGRNMTMF